MIFERFNEMIEAFGGRPMTEEEFRSSDLRNLRTGRDYSAMEAAYVAYDRNGGYFLDETPQGKPSLLFLTLLSYFGNDRAAAIVAKSNVYSDEFTEWFGDWWGPLNVQDEDIEYGPISKVVDENGEPLVVWHSSYSMFDEFKKEYAKAPTDMSIWFKPDPEKDRAFFFSDDKNYSSVFTYRGNGKFYPVYLNMKNPAKEDVIDRMQKRHPDVPEFEYDIIREHYFEDGIFAMHTRSVGELLSAFREDGINDVDGFVGKDMGTKTENHIEYAVPNPNQIKHVENLGTWDPKDNNMYYLKREVLLDEDTEYFNQTSIVDSFGLDLSQLLMNGETVSSKFLMLSMLSRGVFHSVDKNLARALSMHDIPVRIGYTMNNGELAKIVTEGKASVIYINPNELSQVSRGYAGTTLMHEIVHAITVDIINNPKTSEELAFVESNRRTLQTITSKFKHLDVHTRNVVDGMYALRSEKEFAACFASDPEVRELIYELAEKLDRIEHGNKFTRRLKKLVNRLVKAFTKKVIFNENSLVSDIKEYEQTLTTFLENAPLIQRGNISEKSVLNSVYANSDKSTLSHENFIESMKTLEKMQELEKDYLLTGLRKKPEIERGNTKISSFDDVIQGLKTRIDALKSSTLDSITKGRLISTTDTLMLMFIVDEGGKYLAVQNLLKTSVPQIIDTVDELRKIRRENGVFTNTDYMYQMHANIGMYHKAFNTILNMLENDTDSRNRMISEYNRINSNKISEEDLTAVIQNLRNAMAFSQEAINVLEHMLKENVKHTLKTTANEVGAIDMDAYIEALDNNDGELDDISVFEMVAGSADASANEAVRALSYIINKALNKAHFNAVDKGEELLKLQKALKRGEKGWHLYEKDENGDFTGYLIRDLNFGKFYRDYDNELRRINRVLINTFGITDISEEDRVSPDGETGRVEAEIDGKKITAKEYFEQEKDNWLNKHAERRYKSKYYEYYSKLPQRVKDNLSRIRTEINAITQRYKDLYDEKGIPHYEQLSKEDWIAINVLWERRRFLRKDIDEYGNQKEGEDLKDAQALRKLYEEVYHIYEDPNDPRNKNKVKKYHKDLWLAERNKIISQYGEDSKELLEWDERNTRKALKQNEFGEALVFLEIEREFGEQSVSQEYGSEYKKLHDEYKKILSNFRMLNGEYDHESIPQVLINALVELDKKMRNEARRSTNSNSDLSKRVNSFHEILEKYIRYVDSVQLIKAREAAHQQAILISQQQDENDLEALSVKEIETSILANSYGYLDFDDTLVDTGTFVPYKWLLRIETKDPSFMEFEPNDAWIDKEENDLQNEKFDESYGVALVPKRFDEHGNKLYDNSEEYEKIFGAKNSDGTRTGGSETLQALYDGILKTITESNELYGREYADNFMLPQVECTSMERFARRSTYRGVKLFFAKLFGFGRVIGMEDDPNDTEKPIADLESTEGRRIKISGVYPDGRDFHVIPQYYTRKLKHPELISKDIVGITRDYYLMANRYKERSLIKDDVESIIDMIKRQKFTQGSSNKLNIEARKRIGGEEGESNTYNFAKSIAERDLYDMLRVRWGDSWFGRDISKLMNLIKRYTTARNLGMNPKVAMVGFLTTSFTHIINGLVGYKYSRGDMFKAGIIVMKEFGVNLFGARFIGNRLTKNKLMLLMEYLDLSDQAGRKTEHSNRNRILQALYKNSTFGLLSAADIHSKAVIMVATLLSYRYVDGRFMTKHMIEESRYDLGEEEYKRLMNEFKKSKVNAYNIFEGDTKLKDRQINSNDTKLHIKEEYKDAWEQIKHTASSKALKNAEQADGMATRLQKAMMTRNFVGAFVLIHRQYIPLMLLQTFGKRVYDYDALEYKNAQFRTLFNYVTQLCCSNVLAAAGGGAFVGVAFGGFSFAPIIAASSAAVAYSIYKKFTTKRKSLKDINKEFFGNSKSAPEGSIKHANLLANRYQMKQTLYEVLLINCFMAPVANLMCALADNVNKDDDKYKWMLLQTLAYWARAAQFETSTKYNFVDLLNNIKSATAATAASDSAVDIFKSFSTEFGTGVAKSLFMQTLGFGRNVASGTIVSNIYNTYTQEDDDDLIREPSPYAGETKVSKFIQKAFPWHNIKEQILNPELKRRYQENQVMRLTKDDKESILYDILPDWITDALK